MTAREVLFGPADLADTLEELVGSDLAGDREPSPRDAADAYVHVGQLFVSARPCTVTTILGSCVSVCLWDAAAGVGGLNHFLLPQLVQNGTSSSRFGNIAIQELLSQIGNLGGLTSRLRAKVFGGASVIETAQSPRGSLGEQNVELACRMLRQEGIPIVAQDVGGTQGRKLVFQTGDGTAWVRKI